MGSFDRLLESLSVLSKLNDLLLVTWPLKFEWLLSLFKLSLISSILRFESSLLFYVHPSYLAGFLCYCL